jgi:hypothetical protein
MNDASRGDGDPTREPIYRLIRWVLFSDVVVGLALMLYGWLGGGRPFVIVGFALALIGAGLWLFFTNLGERRAPQKKRRQH